MKLVAALIIASLAAAECPPMPPPHPVGDAAPDRGSCVLACATLRSLGCREGLAANCVATCDHVESSRLTELHPGCLAAATSKEAARACGSVRCE